jgi:proton-dependent oligopeptide transporter, POT family
MTPGPPTNDPAPTGAADASHPPGLYVLFGAEAWERFSYYGMRALLTLYLVNQLQYDRKDALAVYGIYTSLVYLTPIIGGYFADKVLGRRKAVLIGGALMALGHLVMVFEPLLHFALGFLIVGNGFFKPNISTIVGGLYGEGDARRDGGFTIFYMGINLGAYLAPLICGALGQKVGWHYGFSAAAIGMACGLSVFIWGQKWLEGIGMPPGRSASGQRKTQSDARPASLSSRDYVDCLLWVAASVVVTSAIVLGRDGLLATWTATSAWLRATAGGLMAALLIRQLYRGSSSDESQRLHVLLILCAFNIFFWMGFEQGGGTMALFADQQTDRNLGWSSLIVVAAAQGLAAFNIWRTTREERSGRALWMALVIFFTLGCIATLGWGGNELLAGRSIRVEASQFQTINPLLIVALAPTFSRIWVRLDQGRFKSSTPTKMAIGMVILGLGFVVMFVGHSLAEKQGKVNAAWLAAVYSLHTIGELCLSPIGLSIVNRLAPTRVESLAMGFWLFSSAIANYLAGTLESLLSTTDIPIYGFLVVSSIGPALLLLAIRGPLIRWMHQC